MTNLSTLTVQIDGNSARLVKELKKANKRSSKFARDVKKHGKQMAKGFAAVGAAAAAAFAYQTIKNTKEFTKSISELAAITGASGKDLKFLSDEARRYGKTTMQTASQAATAFKLVASAKPDLLANAQALSMVTKETITLSEAAGIALPDAAKALGESLNQFGAGADQASRFINVLAAGSQQGAVEIPQISEALVNAGVAASQAGLDFEETVAALEALGKSGIKGALAGSKLRTVLSRLTTQANDSFNPSVVGMSKALENLDKAQLSSTELLKMFGQDSVYVVQALLSQRTEYERLNVAIRGTNTAYEQQAKMNDNLDGDLKQLNSRFEDLTLKVGLGYNDAMRNATQTTSTFIDFLADNTDVMFSFSAAIFGISQTASTLTNMELGNELRESMEEQLYLQDQIFKKAAQFGGKIGIDNLNASLAESQNRYQQLIATMNERTGKDADGNKISALSGDDPVVAKQLPPLEQIDMTSLPEKLGEYASFTEERTRIALEQAQLQADGEIAIAEALDSHKLNQQILTDEALLTMAAEIATAKVMAEFEAEQAAKGELGIPTTLDERLQMEKDIGDETIKLAADIAAKRAAIEAKNAATIAKYDLTTVKGKENTNKALFGLAKGFAGKNEKLQKKIMLAEKAVTVVKGGIAIVGGVIQALNNPYPANLAFAASVAAQGGALLGTLSSMGGGGGGGSAGPTLSTPSYAGNANDAINEEVEQNKTPATVQVIIEGDVNGVDEYLESKMIPALEAAVNERDFVFIRQGSRQAEEILA
mgnify:CR=1 FL=1